ncbi:MAG: hypothetical protein NXI31_10780 [bacterium]|nr:hypothetical protein [bacterium]
MRARATSSLLRQQRIDEGLPTITRWAESRRYQLAAERCAFAAVAAIVLASALGLLDGVMLWLLGALDV